MAGQGDKPKKKRVWILGAGFSRSLNGPLMNDLLSLTAYRQVRALYKDHIAKDEADLVFWLYHYGSKFQDGPFDPLITSPGEKRWRDAEEFLEILDRSRTDPNMQAVITETRDALVRYTVADPNTKKDRYPGVFGDQPITPSWDDLAKMAKRMVAAACSGFLEGVTPDVAGAREKWIPYLNWLDCLGSEDSILTFNYDLVVEMLQVTHGHHGMAVYVAGIGESPEERDKDDLAKAKGLPWLYKLHGSVNWNIQDDGKVTKHDWTPALLSKDFNIAIATPGDSKMKMADSLFRSLWGRATKKIAEADEIHLIGFRFPPSDAFPREHLLGALRRNLKGDLPVRVVLGPDRNADKARVLALLQSTIGGINPIHDPPSIGAARGLYAHSMYAEDYLDEWSRANQGY